MVGSPDSAEVIFFLAAFAKLRTWVDDSPEIIEAEAEGEQSLIDLCFSLFSTAIELEISERRRRELFSSPTNPLFVKAWGDYRSRYQAFVARVAMREVRGISYNPAEKKAPGSIDTNAIPSGSALSHTSMGAASQREVCAEFGVDKEYLHEIDCGVEVWSDLVNVAGFDLEMVLRRRWDLPFVKIPRHVSASYGEREVLSLLVLLRQAQEAFIYDVDFAALALMRAILEIVLKKHYGATGSKLEILIDDPRKLPKRVDRKDLHKLRELGNDILHFKVAQVKEGGRDKIFAAPEEEILGLMAILQTLIEEAPNGQR